jgi:hypothetical protein
MNDPGAEPRGIKWNSLFPTQRVGELNHFMIKLHNCNSGICNFNRDSMQLPIETCRRKFCYTPAHWDLKTAYDTSGIIQPAVPAIFCRFAYY